ncbi:uncharacterized protein LOC120914564 [Rana temporaria]|uniref:uncharacterized protein LOC120914564 n=1 Tax=Rana temporaria TaxID=8407 RepID=UPI001AAD28C2|nr:uncharacterized protein LOC120914564 [Rana temporaria]
MEFYLRQLMDRAAAPGGEEWMKLCLSLAPPSSVLQEADEAVCSASMSLPATAPPPVPGLFLPHVDRGDRQVDLPMGVNEVGLAASSALPPPEVNDDVQVNANTVAGRTGRSVYKRTQKLRRCYSPSPPKNTKKGRSDNTLTVSAPAQCPIPVVTSDTAPTQRGESLDSAALSDIISNFSLVSGQLQQLLSRTSLPAMDVSHAWSNQQSAQSTCVPSQVMQVEPIANVHEIANVPESCFREAMACELSPLGFHLSANVKAKIWKGDYMDILSLLPAAEDRPLRWDQEKVVDDKRASKHNVWILGHSYVFWAKKRASIRSYGNNLGLDDLLFLEKIRKKINRAMAKFMPSIGGMSFRHVELEGRIPGFYRSDNVHLSDVALDILNLDLQTSVELAVARVGCQTC